MHASSRHPCLTRGAPHPQPWSLHLHGWKPRTRPFEPSHARARTSYADPHGIKRPRSKLRSPPIDPSYASIRRLGRGPCTARTCPFEPSIPRIRAFLPARSTLPTLAIDPSYPRDRPFPCPRTMPPGSTYDPSLPRDRSSVHALSTSPHKSTESTWAGGGKVASRAT